MALTLTTTPAERLAVDLLLVPVAGAPAGNALVAALDSASDGGVRRELRRAGFAGQARQEAWCHLGDRIVLLLGRGERDDIGFWYELADAVVTHSARLRIGRVGVALGSAADGAIVAAIAEGVALARYRFTRYLSAPPAERPLAVALVVPKPTPALRKALADAAVTAAAANYARDLANTPGADLPPAALAAEARRLARRGLRVRVYDRRGLERLRMGAVLGVGRGSTQPPTFTELAYTPRGARRRVALVGKGITFDSGGLSLKTADSMQAQKRDMAGAAIVLGVMSALPALKLPIAVHGYLPSAENMPSGNAIRPGDVLRACNGRTIEVLNTDAEGRLVLADGLAYAARAKPDLILDFATLTAAVRVALGTRCAAVFGTDRGAVQGLIAAAAAVNEKLWELPLIEDYRRDLDSGVADLKNVGEGHAGTIVAALFLREFVAGLPWAHVDFSSTVMSDGYACHPKGASGYGVRTVLRFLAQIAASGVTRSRV